MEKMSYSLGIVVSPPGKAVNTREWLTEFASIAQANGLVSLSGLGFMGIDGDELLNDSIVPIPGLSFSLSGPFWKQFPYISYHYQNDVWPDGGMLFVGARDNKSIHSVAALFVVVAAARVLSVREIEDSSAVWCGKGRDSFHSDESIESLFKAGGIDISKLA
jgi:hypothetical protein